MANWQKSFRRIPDLIEAKVEALDQPFVVFCIQIIDSVDVANGVWAHLGIELDDQGTLIVPKEPVLPAEEAGVWSQRNRYGWAITRTDLPKEPRTYSHETPNFGDWSRGSHTTSWTREVYPRDVIPPFEWGIKASLLRHHGDQHEVSFELTRVFDPAHLDKRELFFAVNVLQESTGGADVRATTEPVENYLRSLTVEWEILPVGESPRHLIDHISERLGANGREDILLTERLEFLLSMKPESLISGVSGFSRYFGAVFTPELVVFENLRIGNAAYVMFEDWARLSQLTRPELLQSSENFERIVHRGRWQRKLATIVRARLQHDRRIRLLAQQWTEKLIEAINAEGLTFGSGSPEAIADFLRPGAVKVLNGDIGRQDMVSPLDTLQGAIRQAADDSGVIGPEQLASLWLSICPLFPFC